MTPFSGPEFSSYFVQFFHIKPIFASEYVLSDSQAFYDQVLRANCQSNKCPVRNFTAAPLLSTSFGLPSPPKEKNR